MQRSEAIAISNAVDAARSAAHALEALASALRIVASPDALHHAVEAAGAARMAREWAGALKEGR